MKRVAIILLVVASSACGLANKGGARGPTIARTQDTVQTPDTNVATGSVDVRTELNR